MSFFNNMRLSLKLSMLILVAFLLLSVVGGVGYYYTKQSGDTMDTIYKDRLVPVRLLAESASFERAINGTVLEMAITTDDKKNQELKKMVDGRIEGVNKNLEVIEKSHLDPKAIEMLAKIKALQPQYRATQTQVIELAMKNKNAEAYALYASSVGPLATEYMDNLRNLADYYTKLSEQMSVDTQAAAAKATQITIGILMAAFLILGLSGFFITRMITKPLHVMILACEELADGDFRDKPRRFVRKDEIGQLGDALANVRSSLYTVLKQVNEAAEQVAASSEELTASERRTIGTGCNSSSRIN